MRSAKSLVAALAVLGLVLAFPLLAQKENPEPCGKSCLISSLTPEQTVKIQKLSTEHQKAMLLLQADLKAKHLDLCQMMREGADQKKLEAKIDEIAKASADIQKKCLAQRYDILSLLTDAQKKEIAQKCSGSDCGIGCGQGASCSLYGSQCCHQQRCGDHKMRGCGQEGCGHGRTECASAGQCAKK